MPTPPALRAAGYFARAYRRTWRASVMTTFVSPTLYLLAMGVGLGTFVDRGGRTATLGHVSYLHFVAPAMAAAAGATTAAGESMFPVMGAIKWQRTYHAMLATPLRVGDILAGHVAWIAVRVATSVAAYLMVMAAFGAVDSYQALAILPVGVLIGLAFTGPLVAFAASQDEADGFSLMFRLVIVPLFLFSGVFFPVAQLPGGLRALAYATPLWHGVELCRALALGRVSGAGLAAHLGYLAALSAAGLVAAGAVYRRRLLL